MFYGFGMMANYNGSDVKYTVKYGIDDDICEPMEIEKLGSEKDEEKKWYDISLKDMG